MAVKGYKRRPFSFVWNVYYQTSSDTYGTRILGSLHKKKKHAVAEVEQCKRLRPWMLKLSVTKRMVREGW